MRSITWAISIRCSIWTLSQKNLLLVGGHVKIGDFGLVKEIRDATQSFMGGLTPAYAPPELFDGRPSRRSDQYSLAIVYQEMLTNSRPFKGSLAAQLASQHLNGDPDISSLPRGDQPVVAKALSKDPEDRYASCREFVEELANRKARRRTPVRTTSTRSSTSSAAASRNTMLVLPKTMEVKQLGPIDAHASKAVLQPTLFVAIGNTGMRIMRRLRKRIRDRIGDASCPSVDILCLDTDSKNLTMACDRSMDDCLLFDDVMPIALRRADEYRQTANEKLEWLSRRWIYNIPKSLQTEGIRPLGRLAFVDHHQAIYNRLHESFESICKTENLAATSATTGLQQGTVEPRVFIVGSSAGGVGSGMGIDMAYAVRTVLLEHGLPDTNVHGLFTHSLGRTSSQREISMANTFAFLSELMHYSSHHGYPGDESCKLPPFDDDRPTFASTYLVDLGAELLEDELDEHLDSLAEYLYLSTLSPCSAFFDACRVVDDDRQLRLRSVGISHAVSITDSFASKPANRIAEELINQWVKADVEHAQIDTQSICAQLFETMDLTVDQLIKRIHGIASHRLGNNPVGTLRDVVLQKIASIGTPTEPDSVLDQIDSALNHVLDGGAASRNDAFAVPVRYSVEENLKKLVRENADTLSESILQIVNLPAGRLAGAELVMRGCHELFGELATKTKLLRSHVTKGMHNVRRQLGEAVHQVSGESFDAKVFCQANEQLLADFVSLRLHHFALSQTDRALVGTQSKLSRVGSHLTRLQKELEKVRTMLQEGRNAASESPSRVLDQPREMTAVMSDYLLSKSTQLTERVNQRLAKLDLVGWDEANELDWMEDVRNAVYRTAVATITDALKEVNFNEVIGKAGFTGEKLAEWIKQHLAVAKPALLQSCGGACRLLVALPQGTPEDDNIIDNFLTRQFEVDPNIFASTLGDVVLCYETQDIPLSNVGLRLIQERPDCAEYASRLHTRTDVDWTPVSQVLHVSSEDEFAE
ncbi:MAG: tubulin-like doman-containing protein [Pirellulaceae bacterium]